MSNIIERVRSIIDVYNSSVAGFEKRCGLSNGAVSQPLKGNKEFSTATISKICYYTPFDEHWLTTGSGEPFKPNISFQDHIIKVLFEEGSDIKTFEHRNGNIPGTFKRVIEKPWNIRRGTLFLWAEDLRGIYPNHDYSWIYENTDKEGIFFDTNQQGEKRIEPTENKSQNIEIMALRYLVDNADFEYEIIDDSLAPNTTYGDVAICKNVDLSKEIKWNDVYYIETDKITILRKVKPDDDPDNIKCVARNDEYDSISIPRKEIVKAGIVIGVIKKRA